jgi:hypothetical protein
MALPPLELFSLEKKPPCCRVAFSRSGGSGIVVIPVRKKGDIARERPSWRLIFPPLGYIANFEDD